ncbi:hypothetical protein Tco_1532896 [Tanacetum coccineum]
MLAPGNYVQWKSRIKRYIDTKPNNELIHYCLQNPPYKFKWTEKTIPVYEGSSETTTEGYMENYKNVSPDIRDQLNAEAEVQPFYHPQNHPTHYTHNSSTKSQQAATRNRGKAIFKSSTPTYDQEPTMVAEDDELSKDKEIDKLMDLISLSFKKIYKPTNNNLRTSSNTSRANQGNTPRINIGTSYDNQRVVNVAGARENVAYHKEKMLLCKQEEAGFQLNAEQAEWRDDSNDEPEDHELEAHYMYMEQIQEVTPRSYAVLILDPSLMLSHCKSDTYLEEQGDTNITIDSLDMCNNGETVDQDDDDDLAKECDLLSSLIEKLKCEIDDNKNHNKYLETSNKALVDKLKGEIEDFKTKNKSLESSNNHFKEANNNCPKTNQMMFKDTKRDLMSYKMEYEKSSNEYTRKINDLNQMILDMKKELFAHQETISIMSQEKEAQIKFYKTREDKEIDKDEAGVILTDEQNDFLFVDASKMEKIEELGANICLMDKIQPADNTFDVGPSYDSAFIIEIEAKTEKNVDLILKHGIPLQECLKLDKPLSVLGNSEISLHVRDTEDTIDEASKSQQ